MLSRGWHWVWSSARPLPPQPRTLHGLTPPGLRTPSVWRPPSRAGSCSDLRIDGQAHAAWFRLAQRPHRRRARGAGYVGIKRVFERHYGGWLAVFGEGHRTHPEDIYKGLGVLWETEWIVIKPYRRWNRGTRRSTPHRAARKVDVSQTHGSTSTCRSRYAHGGWRSRAPAQAIGAQMTPPTSSR